MNDKRVEPTRSGFRQVTHLANHDGHRAVMLDERTNNEHMKRSSRYVRPSNPPGMVVTARDRAAIQAVFKYRYLTAEHLSWLAYQGAPRREMLRRLRLLWAHRFFDRYYFTGVADGSPESLRGLKTPVYTLAANGARAIIADDDDITWDAIPKTPAENRVGYVRLKHNLVANDLLASIDGASLAQPWCALTETESELWRRCQSLRRAAGYIVSDGAFTIRRDDGAPVTFHLEVVRADAKGGNATVLRKMQKYVALNRAGFFRTVYGHQRVRAVLITTTTTTRAENFRKLTRRLPRGESMFWFTGYEKMKSAGPPVTLFTPSSVTAPVWLDAAGDHHSLISAAPAAAT